PLVPLNEELDLIAIQSPDSNVQSSPPVGELPVLPTSPMSFPDRINRLPHSPALEYLSSKGTPPLSQLPLIPLATSGLHQWPGGQRGTGAGMGPSADGWPAPSSLTVDDWERCWATQVEVATMSPNPATFSDRHSFGNAPSNNLRLAHYSQLNHSEAIAPMDYIGTGQQPPSFTTTTQAFPSGADFLAGVGQQPPSILAESSEAEASIWSAEPMSFKWTRDRLNQELAILMANTTPADCQVILAAAATERNQDIGGPTVASLTGYEWLSQFTLPQQRAEPARPPIHMILPLPHAAPLTSKFGWRTHPIFGGQRFHYGLDYGAPHGTPILASIPGRVETTGSLDGYGLTVIVENEELGLRTLYAHMSGIGVNKGDGVEQGVVLGWVGNTGNSTGPHLHFEVHRYTDGGWVAIDPLQAAADLIEATKP
ncbi:MAG: M23 family metallopeptidase, partial [Leptolyngbyaceae bacterium]|nr:M23 family metallopeptidase [Leptolyngbyaceae bacterium]